MQKQPRYINSASHRLDEPSLGYKVFTSILVIIIFVALILAIGGAI